MATHSCILAWEIPWTEEPGGLQSMGSQRATEGLTQDLHLHELCRKSERWGQVCLWARPGIPGPLVSAATSATSVWWPHPSVQQPRDHSTVFLPRLCVWGASLLPHGQGIGSVPAPLLGLGLNCCSCEIRGQCGLGSRDACCPPKEGFAS